MCFPGINAGITESTHHCPLSFLLKYVMLSCMLRLSDQSALIQSEL